MQDAQTKQFKLTDDGKVFFQKDPTNPLPGEEIGVLQKGEHPLTPVVKAHDAAQQEVASAAVARVIAEALEVLVGLKDTQGLSAPVAGICDRLYDALGILPREALQDFIEQLDMDMRAELRSKNVRLGPVLAFMPALNKPAGVRLRGLLYALYNDMALPAPVPNDGIVSVKVEEGVAPKEFYQAIAYPLYAGRAVRIDMLDRVISAVYDSADKGKFQAQHKMAEWLGCPIADLYAILEEMGHVKIHDPADEVKAQSAETPKEEAVEDAAAVENPAQEEQDQKQESADAQPVAAAPEEKPELATFALKKGVRKAPAKSDAQKPKKPFKAKPKGKPKKERSDRPRVIKAEVEAKPEDNPFAILGQLKK